MTKYIITKNEIEKLAQIQWKKISTYLKLGISWNDFLKKMEQKARKGGMKFTGFSIAVNTDRPHWHGRFLEMPKKGWAFAFIGFIPNVKSKEKAEQLVSHELFHIYQSLYLCIDYPDRLMGSFREACADVVSVRTVSSKKYQKAYTKGYYYTDSLIMALADQMKNLGRDELIELVNFPKTRKDLKPLTKRIVELLSKTDHTKWIKRIEKDFKKQGKIWWEVIR